MAPYEVLVQATISDLYFLHERATRIAVWNLFLLCGIAGAGFISGYIIEDLGYEWTFGICGILFGVFGLGVLFLVPETTYIRPNIVSDMMEQAHGKGGEKTMHIEQQEHEPVSTVLTGNGSGPNAATEAKMSYWKSLRFVTGCYSDAAMWRIFTRPLIVFWYPCVLWGFLIYGKSILEHVQAPIHCSS